MGRNRIITINTQDGDGQKKFAKWQSEVRLRFGDDVVASALFLVSPDGLAA